MNAKSARAAAPQSPEPQPERERERKKTNMYDMTCMMERWMIATAAQPASETCGGCFLWK